MPQSDIRNNESLLEKLARALAVPELDKRDKNWMDGVIGALSIIAMEKSWHYVSYICALHYRASETFTTDAGFESDAEGLIRLCIYNHRVAEALQLRMAILNGSKTLPLPVQAELPARRWILPNTNRWVNVTSIRAIFMKIREGASGLTPGHRSSWIKRQITARFKELNDRLMDGAQERLMRHAGALNGMQWRRLTKDTMKEVVHIRLHFSTAFLTASVRVGSITARHQIVLPLAISQNMSEVDKAHMDSHFSVRFLSHAVYEILLGIRTRIQLDDLLPRLKALYDFLLGPLFARFDVASNIEALGERPTLVVVTHGVLAQLPFTAFHDGNQFLGERFDIVQSPPLYPEEDFGTGDIDYEALTGGDPIYSSDVIRAMADTVGLPAAERELETYRRLASSPGQNIEIGPLGKETNWTSEDLRWLFAGDISVLSSHIRTSPSNVDDTSLLSPSNEEFSFRKIVASRQNNKLVVLAGCDSQGQTDWLGGGENSVVSLFRRRGAQATVSTLWSVNDLAARLYNEALISAIRRGQPRAKAHGEATRYVKAYCNGQGAGRLSERRAGEEIPGEVENDDGDLNFDHPVYWAAFALSGAWR